jgi:hypothetical protein
MNNSRVIGMFGKAFKFTPTVQEQILTDEDFLNHQETYSVESFDSDTSFDDVDIVSEYLTVKLQDQDIFINVNDEDEVYFGYKIDSINCDKYDVSEGVDIDTLNEINTLFNNLNLGSLCDEITKQIEQQNSKFYLLSG